MNFVFVSPNFPERYFKFCEALKDHGFRVLGVGDARYDELSPRLKNALSEYVSCNNNMRDYKTIFAAIKYFENKYGHIDYLESNNEWWLSIDAKLREDFSITTGQWPKDMEKIQSKIEMKKYFAQAGLKTARFVKGDNIDEVINFANSVSFPIFAKPVVGVGACKTYKLKNLQDINNFFATRDINEKFVVEEYIDAEIVSFDGICNSSSEVVFCVTENFPIPIADVVNLNTDDYYFANYDVPPDLLELGKKMIKAFGIKKRFFHIELWHLTKDLPGIGKTGEYLGLETNMRPPGGFTPDLIDFAASASVYQIYADVMMYDKNLQDMSKKKFISIATSRRDRLIYKNSDFEIKNKYSLELCMSGRYSDAIKDDMGDTYYFAKFDTIEKALEFQEFVRKKL